MTLNLPNPVTLAQSFSLQWEAYGNTSSPELIDQWTTIFKTLNDSCLKNINNSEVEYSVIPAVTGSGKTQCAQWYAAKLSRQFKNGPGMLIVTRLNKEADKLANQINEWSGDNEAAVAYNTDSKVRRYRNESQLEQCQTVIISHEYFIRHHHLKSSSSGIYKQVMSYKGNDRPIIIIDESIELVRSVQVTKGQLNKIGAALYPNRSTLVNEFGLVGYLEDNFENLFGDVASREIIGDKSKLIKSLAKHLGIDLTEVVKLFDMKGAVKTVKDDWKLVGWMNELKQLLNDSLYKYTSGKTTAYNASSLELPNRSLIVLDATARVNKVYKYLPKAKLIELPTVKDYSNVTVEMKCSDSRSGLGKSGMVDKNDADLHTLHLGNIAREVMMDEFSQDEFAVFTFKDLCKHSEEKYLYNFGSLNGINDHQDCLHIVIYGIYYRPALIYLDSLYQFRNKDSKALKEDVSTFKYHHIAADIVQMINRGRCRKIEDGKAPEMKVTLMMGNNKTLNSIIESALRSEMPGVSIEELDSGHMMSFTKPSKGYTGNINKSDQLFLDCIDTNQDRIKVSDIHKCAQSTDKEKKGINGRIKNDKKFISYKLEELGYEITKEGGNLYLVKTLTSI
ncbi:MAG: DEAD/DEAH box helicase family protein [Proteobacteria bacterium]|nr:DEAD/DEAH box helicase family protein [Pseudomonadota bacterium]